MTYFDLQRRRLWGRGGWAGAGCEAQLIHCSEDRHCFSTHRQLVAFFSLMSFCKMFMQLFTCIWIPLMCHFSSSIEMIQFKKKREREKKKCYFKENSSLFEKVCTQTTTWGLPRLGDRKCSRPRAQSWPRCSAGQGLRPRTVRPRTSPRGLERGGASCLPTTSKPTASRPPEAGPGQRGGQPGSGFPPASLD